MARDALGNQIKEGMLVVLNFNGHATLARVAQVSEGGVIGSSRDQMPVAGLCVLQIIVPLQFHDEVPGVWVVSQPSNQDLEARDAAAGKPI